MTPNPSQRLELIKKAIADHGHIKHHLAFELCELSDQWIEAAKAEAFEQGVQVGRREAGHVADPPADILATWLTEDERHHLALQATYEASKQDDPRWRATDADERDQLRARWRSIADAFLPGFTAKYYGEGQS